MQFKKHGYGKAKLTKHPERRAMPFGKYRGRSIGWVASNDRRYLEWFATNIQESSGVSGDIFLVLHPRGA